MARSHVAKRWSPRMSQSHRAGLLFPVSRIVNKLRKQQRVRRLSKGAGVYLTGVIEYVSAEILELAGNACKDSKKKRITPQHIKLAICYDGELEEFLKNVVIPGGGVIPAVQPNYLNNKKTSKSVKKTPNPLLFKPIIQKTSSPKKGVTTLNKRTLNKGQTLIVLQADITDVEVDAVVSHYYLSGMVGSAISRRGGSELQAIIQKHQSSELSSLDTCEANMSDASTNLLCKKIIHINSPSWESSQQILKINELTKTVENILVLAETNKLKSVALPNISSGGNGYPKQVAAQTILRAVNSHFKVLENNPALPKSSITEVFFVLYDTESVNVYTSELGKLNIQ